MFTLIDYRIKANFWVSVIVVISILPLAVNHLYRENYIIAAGDLLIVLLFAVNAIGCYRGNFYSNFVFWTIVPITNIFLGYALLDQGVGLAFWCYPALVGYYFILPEKKAWFASLFLLAVTLPSAWKILDQTEFIRFVITLIGISGFSATFVRVIENQYQELKKQATLDSLTGTFNRVLLHSRLDKMIKLHSRTDSPVSIIGLDIDNFKLINDTWGHERGDSVLKGVGQYLKTRVRVTDEVYRVGGEEFLILLPDTSVTQAKHLAEELRKGLSQIEISENQNITASFGVSTYSQGDDKLSLLRKCDQLMYKAKRQGRNKVIVDPD
jgi:diguanylate cyclase (GGDEF)-like protein